MFTFFDILVTRYIKFILNFVLRLLLLNYYYIFVKILLMISNETDFIFCVRWSVRGRDLRTES